MCAQWGRPNPVSLSFTPYSTRHIAHGIHDKNSKQETHYHQVCGIGVPGVQRQFTDLDSRIAWQRHTTPQPSRHPAIPFLPTHQTSSAGSSSIIMSYGYGRGSSRGGDRWDTERFEVERERSRFVSPPRDRFEERESHFGRSGGLARPRERSAEEIFEHRGGRGFEEDRYERREYYDDEPRFERERPIGRDRGQNITIEKEREYDEPRRAPARPGFMRRQSSLDTFDRRPMGQLTRFEREEYGPPARYREEARLPPLTPIPLPRTRGLPPPARRYVERDYEEIRVAEPDYYGDEEYRGIPERVREREIIRRRRRSRSRSRGSTRASQSVRSSSSSSGVSERSGTTSKTTKGVFPKKGKTRMPARLVSKKAIIDLGYSFEEDVSTPSPRPSSHR